MQAHPPAHAHADEADLAALAPHPGQPGPPLGRQGELGQGADEQFLEQSQPLVQVAAAPAQQDDGVAHQLTGPVPGDVTAAVHAPQVGERVEQVGRIPAPADGVHGRVFEQEQGLRSRAGGHGRGQALLGFQGRGVVHAAAVHHLHGRAQPKWARR